MFVGKQVRSHAMACHNPVLSLVADGMARVMRLVLGRMRVISRCAERSTVRSMQALIVF